MTSKKFLVTAILLAASALKTFAGYIGPDNVEYQYKIINWMKLDVFWVDGYELIDGVHTMDSSQGEDSKITGVAVYGPNGLEDYSASKQYNFIEHGSGPGPSIFNPSANTSYYHSFRRVDSYTPERYYWRWREYDRQGSASPTITDDDSTEAATLGVTIPDTVTNGTIMNGTGFVSLIGADPEPIVGDGGWLPYSDPLNRTYVFVTAGSQSWTTITWTNTAPSISEPEDPEWTDSGFEDEP